MCILPIVWATLAVAFSTVHPPSSRAPGLADSDRWRLLYNTFVRSLLEVLVWCVLRLPCGSLPISWSPRPLRFTPLPRYRSPPLSARNRRHMRHRARRTTSRSGWRRTSRAAVRSTPVVHLPGSRSWTWRRRRLHQNVLRLGLLALTLFLTGGSLWPVGACAFFFILQEILLLLTGSLATSFLVRLVPRLTLLTRVIMRLAFLIALARLVAHNPMSAADPLLGTLAIGVTSSQLPPESPQRDPVDERLGTALAFSYALKNTTRVRARLELKDGTLSVILPDTTTLELPAGTLPDQRLAMVIARLFRNNKGRALFTSQDVSTAFGKKLRHSTDNHMRQLRNAGGSLVQMILRGTGGRPRYLPPALERRVASFWERDPLATPQMCLQWLATQVLPEGTQLPSLERLAQMPYIPGNLVTVRHAMARLFTHSDEHPILRHDSLLSRLFEVIDAQDRALQELNGSPVPRPGVVHAIVDQVPGSVLRPTRTSHALCDVLSPLTTVPSEEDDQALMTQVGLEELIPLHCATLYCSLRLSIGQIAALVGHSKSLVYRALLRFARAIESIDLFPPAQHFSGVLGLDEKWLKIPKSYTKEERLAGKTWRYAHFAVDARTGDLLHIDVYETSSNESARSFLVTLRAMGIRPRVVVTDMWAGYEALIREVFGERVIHHFCLFHHLQAVRERLRQKCGKDWKQSALLRDFVRQVDRIYDCEDRRTAKKRLEELMTLRPALLSQHPEAAPLLDLIAQRFPKVVNALGTRLIPTTNNITERSIRAFNQHYKNMAGLESIETARIQLVLFRFFYRLTPQREMARKEERNTCPVQRAGWDVHGIPVADYIRRLTEALVEEPEEAGDAATPNRSPPTDAAPPGEQHAAA